MKPEYDLLIGLLREQMTGHPAQIPQELDGDALIQLAQRHKLETFLYAALEGRWEEEKLRSLAAGFHKAVFRDAQFDDYRKRLTQVLTEQQVRHVYLRGICLKHDYPAPAMRTMSDMDILVLPEDFPKIRKCMESLGGQLREGDGNHRTYALPMGLTVEFHPNLIHCSSPVATGVNPGWQYVPEGQGSGEVFMTEEGFYLNVIAHLANHFAAGGVGVRFVLDIWVCRYLRKNQPDRAFVEAELERIGLLEFTRKIEALAEVWFSGAPGDEGIAELAEYILTSGIHGFHDRAVLNAVSFSGSGLGALKNKIFYPRQDLETRYDWVKGRSWLLPIAWLVRAFRAVTRHWDKIFSWGKKTGDCSKTAVRSQQEMLARFGIKTQEDH